MLKFDLVQGIPDALKTILTLVKVKLTDDFMGIASEDRIMEMLL